MSPREASRGYELGEKFACERARESVLRHSGALNDCPRPQCLRSAEKAARRVAATRSGGKSHEEKQLVKAKSASKPGCRSEHEARSYKRLPKAAPRPPVELLTDAEAYWQIAVLVLFAVVCLAAALHHSVLLSFVIFASLAICVAVVLAAQVAASRTPGRPAALKRLKSAIASKDEHAIRVALWHAQAVGLSAEELASTEELRAAVRSKQQAALRRASRSGGDDNASEAATAATRVAAALDKLRAGALSKAVAATPVPTVASAVVSETSKQVNRARASSPRVADVADELSNAGPAPISREPLSPRVADTADELCQTIPASLASRVPRAGKGVKAVGLTAEELAFAEVVLRDVKPLELVLAYSEEQEHWEPAVAPQSSSCAASPERLPVQPPPASSPTPLGSSGSAPGEACLSQAESQQALQSAVAGGNAARIRAALSAARASGVSDEELDFAEVVLQIEEAREQRQHASQQSSDKSSNPRASFADKVLRIKVASC